METTATKGARAATLAVTSGAYSAASFNVTSVLPSKLGGGGSERIGN